MSLKAWLARLEARAIRQEAERIAQEYGLSADEILEEARKLLRLAPDELERKLAALEGDDEITVDPT
jgi:hypothetical protein